MRIDICCVPLMNDMMAGRYKLSPRMYMTEQSMTMSWWLVLSKDDISDECLKVCPYCDSKVVISVQCQQGDVLEFDMNMVSKDQHKEDDE